ncbi:ABC transporter permease [Adhaeribacter pallidiroseus]|uniref:Macrolide export ATP-binding/permease protein MacB n=1 Tax=Adhaeribacter pallidiroseus TaxID=2072847 RepID=A0A369QKW0_9BACT|nr:ABC transporter permease [Adhaeribacter pallidiroseus]RDC65553.1 Macrolide export ATP-binding/permease protein MacB [Adhaeribacter pallidiroseus]
MLNNYLKIALRNLLRHKGYSFINVAGLAVGIACCTFILLFVQDELAFEKNHRKAKDIYRLTITIDNNGTPEKAAITSPRMAPQLKADYPEVKQFVRLLSTGNQALLRFGDKGLYETGGYFADSTLFEVFDYPLIAGNSRTALNEPNSIVLSQELAQKYFGHENPIGKIMELETQAPYTLKVTGILAEVPRTTQVRPAFLVPMRLVGGGFLNQWFSYGFTTYLLVNENFNAPAFDQKLQAFTKKYQPNAPGTPPPPALHLQPLLEVHLNPEFGGQLAPVSDIKNVYLFSALALFIILLACINFMNLATARSQNRSKEVGVRKVIGASRGQLIRQFLSESLLLSFFALLLAMGIVYLALPLFNQLSGKYIQINFLSNSQLWLGLLALTLFAGLVAGIYPAFYLSGFRPVQVLKGRLIGSASGSGLRKGLVVLQFAISIAMIVGTAVVYNQMLYVQNKRLGFSQDQMLIINIPGNQDIKKSRALKEQIRQLPNVKQATLTGSIPADDGWWRTPMNPIGKGNSQDNSIIGFVLPSDFDLAKTFDLELVAGRFLDKNFATDTARAIMLNEAAVAAFGWQKPEAAVGQRVNYGGGNDSIGHVVVGILKDFNFQSLHQKVEPLVLTANTRQASFIVVKVQGADMAGTLAQLEQKWNAFDPKHPFDFTFMNDRLQNQYQAEMKLGRIFATFAGLAIFIACLGLFGLASFTTEQRTKEIGIRKVLGASVSHIMVMLSRDFVKLVLLANLIAWPVAWYGMSQWLQDFEYRTPISWWTFGIAAASALLIALATISVHALKAAIANPVNALRSE